MVPALAFGAADPRVELATPGYGGGAIERYTIRFTEPMVPLGDPRAAAPVTVQCPVGGEGRWVDQRTFVHEFASGLPGGTVCRLTTRPDLRSLTGVALSGTTSFVADAGGPAARAILPPGDEIEEDQIFLVAANMPALPASVGASAYCAVDGLGEKIAVDVLSPDVAGRVLRALAPTEWRAQRFLEEAGLPDRVPADAAQARRVLAGVTALKCRRPLPPGRDVAVVWGKDIRAPGGRLAGQDRRFDFRVREPFTARFECRRVNPRAGCNPVEKAWVRFTAPVPLAQAQAVRLEVGGKSIAPTLSDEEKRGATISDLTFAAPLPAETTGRLMISAGIQDESGRALANAARFPLEVRVDAAPPLVKFAAPFGILEAKEGGVLPVTVRNVEPALQGRNLAVGGRRLRVEGDAEVARWLRAVDEADDEKTEEVKRGRETVSVNRTGDTPILRDQGAEMRVGLPARGRDFEVVGLPLKEAGFYVVELASPALGRALLGRNAPRYVAAAALVTDLSVHFKWGREQSLAWVTELSTGRPAANAEVRVTDSCTGRLLARGVTDRTGGLRIPAGLPDPQTYGSCESEEAHPLMVSARRGGDFSFTLTAWGEGIRPYDFELPYGYSAPGEQLHTVFDRALVRQGETVHMKHILRLPDGGGFRLAPGFAGTLTLRHRGSDTSFELPVAIDANGTGESAWAVPAGAPMGDYDLSVATGDRRIETGQSVRVDEYRLPTMRASVSGPKAAAVRPSSLPLDLYAGYLSGGGASGLAVDVRVGWFARSAAPQGYEAYSFGGRPVAEGVRALDGDQQEERTELPPTQTLPATLGSDGTARTVVDVPGSLDELTDMRVEMDYQDANGETLTASRVIPIYPSAIQLGARTDGWLMREHDLRLKFVALDTDGKPAKGQKIAVTLYRREVLTARRRLIGGFYAYDNRMRTTRLNETCSATTDAQGLAECQVDPGVSGEVYAVAETQDADGRTARAVRSVWLAGDDEWWFGGDNGDRMDLIPERTAYKAGETARFQVRMPFRSATALVTVEREGVLSSFVTELSGKDPVVEVPMPGAYAPDVFVSVMAVRGRARSGWWSWLHGVAQSLGLTSEPEEAPEPTALTDLAKPAYRLGIAKVTVGWEAHRLAVAVKADRERYAARDTARVAVQVKRPDGSPARTADLAFVAVDEALLQLAPNESWDVLTAMMGERPLSVLTSTAQTQVVGKRHYGRKAVEAGGGGGDAAAALNRENFQPVLLWRGRVALDAQGRAIVPVTLSDALSSFRLVAVATDGAQLFGTGTASIRTAQDLQLFAGVPSLVRGGDRYAAQFTLRNGSDRPMTVTAEVAVSPRIAVGRPLTVRIPAGGAVPVAWNLTAPDAQGTLRWQVSARSGDGRAADRITVAQDVVPLVPVEVWASALARVGTDTLMPIAAPAGALPGRGRLTVALADSLTPSLAGVRAYMADYPFNCFEQRLSRAVATGDRAAWNALAAELPTYQASDGLLRYFPGDSDGSEALTAYVLQLTAEAGLAIPDGPRARMIEGMRAVLDGRVRHETYGDVRLQRLAAFSALARQGAGTAAMLGQVGLPVNEMPSASLADYLLALDRLSDLANGAALKGQAEAELRRRLVFEGTRLDLTDQDRAAWWLMSSGDESAAKVALAVIGRPGWQDDAPRLVVGATLRQQRGHWDTTTANAWGTVMTARFARIYPASVVAGTTTLTYSGTTQARNWPLAAEARTVGFPLAAAPAPLRMMQAGGAGPWATMTVSAVVPLRRPLMAGYRLTRSVEPVRQRHAGRWTRGDVARVTLTVEASAERSWVALSDPLPAGATVIGRLGGQSEMLREGGADEGAYPAYTEAARGVWRAYYAWVPRGRFTASYAVRLNGAGRFNLPPSRVEAMYSPAIRAAVPNAAVAVADR